MGFLNKKTKQKRLHTGALNFSNFLHIYQQTMVYVVFMYNGIFLSS